MADRRIAIFRYASRERWFATDDRCSHRGSEVLAGGHLEDVSGGEGGLRTDRIAVGDGIVRIAIDREAEP